MRRGRAAYGVTAKSGRCGPRAQDRELRCPHLLPMFVAKVCDLTGWIMPVGMILLTGCAFAAGPRWVTGPPYFTTSGVPVVWYTNTPSYFTDPGDLSTSVNHAAADALVAAAASVWNVPTSSLMLAQGGQLAEHVSSEDIYLGANGFVFPADVTSANYAAIPIAVIYDSDGSVTDLLMGQGASEPTNCRQSGVTRERRCDYACGNHSTCTVDLEWPLHRPCTGAADAVAVPVDAGIRAGAGAGLVAVE